MATVHGTTTDAFQSLKHILQKNLDNGEETGVSLYVNLNGNPVVDLWGGFADEKCTQPWTEDTIVNCWSTTKNVTSLAALILVDRGLLDLEAPVAKYWPEFAANGKEKVLVRHILSHTSGVSGWDEPFTYSDMYDLETSTARLAAQAPWWEPGTASGYHALNYGHLVGEIVRRVSGKSLREFIKDEIARPRDADFSLGAPESESEWHRLAEIIPPPPPSPADIAAFAALDPQSVAIKTVSEVPRSATFPNTAEFRRAEIGAANGMTNARGLNRIFAPLALKGDGDNDDNDDDGSLLSSKTIDRIFEVQADGPDLVCFFPLRWGIGFGLSHPATTPWIPEGRVFFWFGWGGSFAIVDMERKLTITYVMNKMGGEGTIGSSRSKQYVEAVYEIFRALQVAIQFPSFDPNMALSLIVWAKRDQSAPSQPRLGSLPEGPPVHSTARDRPEMNQEAQQDTQAFVRDVVAHRADGTGFLQLIDLPQLSRADTLIRCGLEVLATGHRATVDCVNNPIFIEDPKFVAPFLRVTVSIMSGVVINNVAVTEVGIKG